MGHRTLKPWLFSLGLLTDAMLRVLRIWLFVTPIIHVWVSSSGLFLFSLCVQYLLQSHQPFYFLVFSAFLITYAFWYIRFRIASPPTLAFGSRIFVMAACEFVKTVIVVGLTFLIFLMPSIKASETAHSCTSNKSLFSPENAVFLAIYLVFCQTRQRLLLLSLRLSVSHPPRKQYHLDFF